jgi:hypothetical protein
MPGYYPQYSQTADTVRRFIAYKKAARQMLRRLFPLR